jgi:N-hydroxyarylamine O-acetyltransferase
MTVGRAGGTVDVDRYLARIGYTGPVDVSAATLAALQAAHMIAVPFENLHVFAGVPVRTSLDWSLPKVVLQRRGGWCFELNGAFSSLLSALGFHVTPHSAQVWSADEQRLGPELDHLCLVVTVDGERWLVDVGFGDSSITPIRLDVEGEQTLVPRVGRIERVGDGSARFDHHELVHGDWVLQYRVDPTPRQLPEFQVRSDALSSGEGHFTEKPFATRATDLVGGRVWLLKDRLKTVTGPDADPVVQPVSPADWDDVLWQHFALRRP